MKRRRPTAELPAELVTLILHGRVGISTYVAARQVCKTWASACFDELLLIAVAEYTGGLTRTQLQHMLHLQYDQVTFFRKVEISCTALYKCVYAPETVGKALDTMGGIVAINHRPRPPMPSHDELVWLGTQYTQSGADIVPKHRTANERDELLHRRHICRQAMRQVCRQGLSKSKGR